MAVLKLFLRALCASAVELGFRVLRPRNLRHEIMKSEEDSIELRHL